MVYHMPRRQWTSRTPADQKALDVMGEWLANRSLRRAYNEMSDMNADAIDTGFQEWAASTRLGQRSRRAVRRALNVKSAPDFLKHMALVIAALNEHIASLRGEPYAMLVEVSSQYAADWYVYGRAPHPKKHRSFAPKSSAWLAGPVINRLTRRPAMLIPVYQHTTGGVLAEGLVHEARRQGIRHFVHVDDAIYSGLQKSELVALMCETVEKKKMMTGPPTLWIGAAYATATGLRAIRRAACQHMMKIHVYAAGTIAAPTLPWLARAELLLKRQRVGPTMTVLPYKVPNAASFGPALLSNALAERAPDPVYKARKYARNVPRW